MAFQLVGFALLIIAVIYGFSVLLGGNVRHVEPKTALVYVGAVALIGVFGEVFVGSIYNILFGSHLWNYTLFPAHNGFTSLYAPVIWGCYGFYLYLLHDSWLARRGKRGRQAKYLPALFCLVFCLETILLEVMADWLYKSLFGRYLYYYLPGDLWHFSSLRGLPFYFLTGLAIYYVVKQERVKPVFYAALNCWLVVVMVFLTTFR